MSNVVNIEEFKNKKAKEPKLVVINGTVHPGKFSDEYAKKVKESLSKVNKLMDELKKRVKGGDNE